IQGHPLSAVEGPLTKIDMQTQAESRMVSGVVCGLSGGRPTYHQAGAGHDAVLMSFDDAAVHTAALAEIIGVHDEKLGGHLVPHFTNFKIEPGRAPEGRLELSRG